MMTRSVASKIFSYVWNWEDLFLNTLSNQQACLHPNILDTFLPSAEGLGEISLPVLRRSLRNCQESNPNANLRNAF